MNTQERIDAYVEANGKNKWAAFWLSLLLGPIGYLYVSPLGGVIMILIALATVQTVVVPFVIWLVCILSSFSAAAHANSKLRTKAVLMVDGGTP